MSLQLYVMRRPGQERPKLVVLNVLDEEEWQKFLAMARVGFADELKDERLPEADQGDFDDTVKMFKAFNWGMAYIAPRCGPNDVRPARTQARAESSAIFDHWANP